MNILMDCCTLVLRDERLYDKFNEAPLIILSVSFLNKHRIRGDIFIFIIFINHFLNSKHHVIKEWKKN